MGRSEQTQVVETIMPQPSEARLTMPIDAATERSITRSRDAVRTVLAQTQSSGRLMVVVGPCSIHDPDAAIDYATRLAAFAKKHERQLLVVMRVYVEKPRTTVGWKGLVHHADYAQTLGTSSPDLCSGVLASRSIMLKVAEMGLPVATEMLNPLLVPFFQDIVSLGVIGARTTESQTHREMSSDMPMPMGFKNGTDGGLRVALDAMTSASRSHTVVGVDDDGKLAFRMSRGNPDTFVILRGGSKGPNFSSEHVQATERELLKAGKPPGIVVDCSHGNSMKDYRNQGMVCDNLAAQLINGASIVGVMLESNINEGRQDVPKGCTSLQYGVSITDACVGWFETEQILTRLATAVKTRQTGGVVSQMGALEVDAHNTLPMDLRTSAVRA